MENIHEKDGNLVFEMEDDMYLNVIFLKLSSAIFLFVIFVLLDMESSSILLNKYLGISLMLVGFISSFYDLYLFSNKKKYILKFFDTKIYQSNKKIEIKLDGDIEVYKLFTLWNMRYSGIKRYSLIPRYATVIVYPIIFLPFMIMVNFLMSVYKKNFLIREVLIIVGKDDKEIIAIQIPDEDKKEEELFDYCQNYLNIDIKRLKTTWFISKKDK